MVWGLPSELRFPASILILQTSLQRVLLPRRISGRFSQVHLSSTPVWVPLRGSPVYRKVVLLLSIAAVLTGVAAQICQYL